MRAIAITAFCIFSSTKSIEVITAYDGISTIDDACSSSESYGRSHRFYFTLGERGDGNWFIYLDSLTGILDLNMNFQLGDRLLKVLQKHITYRTETNTTVNIVYPEPNHEGLSLSYVLVKVYQVRSDDKVLPSLTVFNKKLRCRDPTSIAFIWWTVELDRKNWASIYMPITPNTYCITLHCMGCIERTKYSRTSEFSIQLIHFLLKLYSLEPQRK